MGERLIGRVFGGYFLVGVSRVLNRMFWDFGGVGVVVS